MLLFEVEIVTFVQITDALILLIYVAHETFLGWHENVFIGIDHR